jgi:hypothetical protein
MAASAVLAQKPASQAPMPPPEKLFERHAKESGSTATSGSATVQVVRGKVILSDAGISGKITTWSDAEGRSYQVLEIPGAGKVEGGNNGDIEWERSTVQGPKVKRIASTPGSLLSAASTTGAFLRYDKTAGTRTVGQSTVAGKPCWLVESRMPGSARTYRMCFDWETGLLVQTSGAVSEGSSDFQVETTLQNYRQVGAMKAPFLIESGVGQSAMRIEVEEIRFEEKAPPELLEVPEEIQELSQQQLREVEIKDPQPDDPDRPRLKRRKKK